MTKLGMSDQTFIRHDYKQACYRAMLSELSIEEIKEYFRSVPLVIDGKEFKGIELFQHLWKNKAQIPAAYDCGLDNQLEAFLIAKNKNVKALLDKILWLNNNSTHIPGKVLLTWFYPKLESLFNSIDTRDMVFAIITLFTENWLPNHVHRLIKRWEEGEWIKSIMVFFADPTCEELINCDMEFIAGPQVLNGPVMFGLPPFEGFGMISECRPPEKVVWVPEHAPISPQKY